MNGAAALDVRRHQPFRFRTADALAEAARSLGVDLPFADDLGPLLSPATVAGQVVPNRMAVQPMEGCDAQADGSPSETTVERYRRYAAGGSGLIWVEATSIVPEGRANPHQLMLTPATRGAFARLVAVTRQAARDAFGDAHRPLLVLQITHSGRGSFLAPGATRRVACANPYRDVAGVAVSVWRDEELDAMVETFVRAAGLAREAGFDAVDVKACHGYLVSELLAAHTRDDSRYGGPFDRRARFLLDVLARSRARHPGARLAVRLNATDGLPYPYGFGVTADASVDLTEPRELITRLRDADCVLLNVTAGIPATLPHIGRPFDRAAGGGPPPGEHPLASLARLLHLAAALQARVPDLPVVGTGYSWLRQFWPNVAAGVIGRGMAAFAGLGRGVFAYPDAPLALMRDGRLDARKCCVACSHCSELMRAHVPTGCVVREPERYKAKRR